MTNEQARKIFDAAAAGKTGDQLAKLELTREYFTNPQFREMLSDYVFEINANIPS